MKTLFAFFAILGIAGGILAFCFFSPVIAAFALFLYLLVGGGFVFSFAYNHGLRKKWLADPILPDSPEFDDFFWKLTLVNQDWYIEEILHREGLLKNAKPKSYKPGRIRKRTGKKRLKETTAA